MTSLPTSETSQSSSRLAWLLLGALACGKPATLTAAAEPLPSHTEAPLMAPAAPPPKQNEDGIYRIEGETRTKLHPLRAVLFAGDNQNTRYELMVRYRHPGMKQGGEGELVVGGDVLKTSGYGSDSDSLMLDWELSATDASRVAAMLHIARQERHPIGDALKGTFAPVQKTVKSGQLVEMELTIENPPSAPAVKYTQGGRQRGPRDDQFSFTVTRNGQPVAPISAYNLGGISTMPELAPGATATFKTTVDGWADVTAPGHYVVECRWETELAPGGVDPYDDAHRGEAWDKAFTGTVSFDVR